MAFAASAVAVSVTAVAVAAAVAAAAIESVAVVVAATTVVAAAIESVAVAVAAAVVAAGAAAVIVAVAVVDAGVAPAFPGSQPFLSRCPWSWHRDLHLGRAPRCWLRPDPWLPLLGNLVPLQSRLRIPELRDLSVGLSLTG